MDPVEITSRLSDIWRRFQQEGVTDDLTIIEHLAALLLARRLELWHGLHDAARRRLHEGPWSDFEQNVRQKIGGYLLAKSLGVDLPIPRPPERVRYDVCLQVMDDLEEILEGTVSEAELLNEHIIMRLPRMLTVGQYPTPRHLADLMVSLVDPEPNDALLDPACGSGGLLAAAAGRAGLAGNIEDAAPSLRVTATEISLSWARIAWTNLNLHGFHEPDVMAVNALATYRADVSQLYHGVLLNPPFGATVDPTIAGMAFHEKAAAYRGGRSETLLTQKGWDLLMPGGRMAVLLPTGSLFSGSGAEVELRNSLLDGSSELSVVQLPADAIQPYSTIQSFLVVAEKKTAQKATEDVWFYHLAHDGYSAGRNRREEPDRSQIPALEQAVHSLRQHRRDATANGGGDGCWSFGAGKSRGHVVMWTKGRVTVAPLLDDAHRIVVTVTDGQAETRWLFQDDAEPVRGEPWQWSWDLVETEGEGLVKVSVEETSYELRPHDGDMEKVGTILLTDERGVPRGRYRFEGKTPPGLGSGQSVSASLLDSPHALVARLPEDATGWRFGHVVLLDTKGQGKLLLQLDQDQSAKLMRAMLPSMGRSYSSDDRQSGLVILPTGQVLAVRTPRDRLAKELDLRPSEFLLKEEETTEERSPAQLLADIKESQIEMDHKIDFLLGLVERRPLKDTEIPLRCAAIPDPLAGLDERQRRAWQRISEQKEHVEGQGFESPVPFVPQDLLDTGLPQPDIERTMTLFERLGLIVPITIEGAAYYRLLATSDLVEQGDAT